MMFMPSTLIYITLLIISTFMSISSPSWLGAWLGLELNLMSFIPLAINSNLQFSVESTMKYFLVQAFSSLLFIISLISLFLLDSYIDVAFYTAVTTTLMVALLIKLGAAPFYQWFPSVVAGLSWGMGFILMTWQKLGPMVLLGYVSDFNYLILITVMISTLVGGVGGINQSSLRKMMSYSSINHMGWMMAALSYGLNYMFIYYLVYMVTSGAVVFMLSKWGYYFMSQIFYGSKGILSMLILSMGWLSFGGLPPFLGFFPKWMVVIQMMESGMYFLLFFMVMMSLISLYYYVRVCYVVFSQSSACLHVYSSYLGGKYYFMVLTTLLGGLLIVPMGIMVFN
nr:NADH dehydrogenase subunit 2 [Nigrobaetis niger]